MTTPAGPGSSGSDRNAAKLVPSAASSVRSSESTGAPPEMTGIGGLESSSKHIVSSSGFSGLGQGAALGGAALDELGELGRDRVVERRRLELGQDPLPDLVRACRRVAGPLLGPLAEVGPVGDQRLVEGGAIAGERVVVAEEMAAGRRRR